MLKYEGCHVLIHKAIKVGSFLAQQITTETDLRCLETPGPGFLFSILMFTFDWMNE